MQRRITTSLALALCLLMALAFSGAAAAASTPKYDPPKYDPLNDPRPAQGVMDKKYYVEPPQLVKDHPLHSNRFVAAARRTSAPTQPPGTGDAGVYFTQNASLGYGTLGLYSGLGGFNITKPSINNAIVVYAPTTYGNGSCLETTIVSYSPSGSNQTAHALGLWDWCPGGGGDGVGGWQAYITIDTTWGAKYLHQSSVLISLAHFGYYVTDKYMQVRVYKTTNNPVTSYNCWRAEIWNFQTGGNDLVATSCGIPSSSIIDRSGWSFFETYGYMPPDVPAPLSPANCTALGTWNLAQTMSLHKQNGLGGAWVPMTSSDFASDAVYPHPCYQGTGGSNNWHFTSQVNGAGISWQVCGPAGGYQSVACRP